MYKTYENNKPSSNNLNYEEKLIPEEICQKEKKSAIKPKKKSIFGNLFPNMENDDLIIIALLFFLLHEENDDNILVLVLLALLFIT